MFFRIYTLILVIFFAVDSKSATLSSSSDVKVRNALSINEEICINFGTIEAPATDVYIDVGTDNSLGAGTTANMVDTTEVMADKIIITGSFLSTINITAHDNENVSGISFVSMVGDYDGAGGGDLLSGISNQPPPGDGSILYLGAKLLVEQSVTEGDYSPTYTIAVNYE